MTTKTYSAKPADIRRQWYVVDASDEVLGRLATRVASVLRGKHKPQFTPHLDVGDFVVVINAERVKLTGAKLEQKMFRRHSGYPGGLTSIPYERLLQTHPERAIERAVWGMLPKTSLGRKQLRKLKVYKGDAHPHRSQKPVSVSAEELGVVAARAAAEAAKAPPAPKPTRKPKPKRPAKAKAEPAAAQAQAKPKPKRARSRRKGGDDTPARTPEVAEPEPAAADVTKEEE